MSILRLESVRREIGDLVILADVSAAVAHGERIGLVGANGAGKTTLLEIVAGREEADGGTVHVARGTRLGLLTQEAALDPAFGAATTVRGFVRSGAVELVRMERTLAGMEAEGADAVQSPAYASLRERFEAADGYHLDQRVEASLSGLGIDRRHWEREPGGLSGGEHTRVALARLLTADPDLLMLDEPTNHLDVAALEWLEQALVRRSGALLVASHDRAFLDNVVSRIWELRDRRLSVFRGDYKAYLLQREGADARARAEQSATAAAIAREEELVQRYRSQRKHVKMHEHERRLERLRAEAPAPTQRSATLRLPGGSLLDGGAVRSGEVAVSLRDLVCGYRIGDGDRGSRAVAGVSRLEADRGDRIGLVGPNGAGKSTLLRTIAGRLPALEGVVSIGRNVMPGYLSQLRHRPLPGTTVLDALLAAAPVTPGAARSYLARFLFRGDEVEKPVHELSGGERSRLELALLGVGTVNLLLLDEPTNHLDIPAREALETFLRDSDATVIVVSHDRRLLESVCRRLWVVEPDPAGSPAAVAPFEGGYREWRAAVADGWAASGELAGRGGAGVPRVEAGRSPSGARVLARGGHRGNGRSGHPPDESAKERDGHRPLSKDAYRRERQRIEIDLDRLASRKAELESGLEHPGTQANYVELRRLTSELADVDRALSQAEDAWLILEERAPA